MDMERVGLWLMYIGMIAYFIFVFVISIITFPFGLIGFAIMLGSAILFFKVWQDRMDNEEDDYYSKNVDI